MSEDNLKNGGRKEPQTTCRREGGSVGPTCVISQASRISVIPIVWWAVFGFGGISGVQLLRDHLGLSPKGASALTALVLAVVTAAAFLPCCIHRRILRRRRAHCEDCTDQQS